MTTLQEFRCESVNWLPAVTKNAYELANANAWRRAIRQVSEDRSSRCLTDEKVWLLTVPPGRKR